MHPDLFSIGPFTLHTYGLFVATGFLAALLITVRLGKDQGIGPQQTMDMGFLIILSAIVGSRIMYVLMNISHYIKRPLDVFKVWEGGLVFSGGILCVVLTVIWYAKRHDLSFWKVADLWSPAMAVGQGIGRIGCFMAGCCYGRPSGPEWGVVFTDPHSLAPLNIPLYPTQLFSSISGFIIFFILLLIHRKRRFQGQVFLWLLMLHSTARLFIERFRGDDRGVIIGGQMSVTQLVTLLILLGAVVTLIIFKRRQGKS
ncbi:MAG: prolipoprotein diacylglyceryl transferase [Deltaproteobacteria bacterium]|nr:prolipoprotein diacylglyceryl transferase [Deltaproteobacteria bacterium]MBW2049373.1 prolipoprotein diacylglyceryl transferase [Deltaproteobacteria bacterium]MBW2110586.1 prolipoprotein diacylglyceryl transferase [Deltaproteobacteria bacterium]MBW2352121.1 prolipoprotein diacylglyceryl transferase [Deltaproteobacteria bacterium]HDZ89947.1 prolipoprotein diacylglyceryl transferase [Deltaproteobacteria bacterium]